MRMQFPVVVNSAHPGAFQGDEGLISQIDGSNFMRWWALRRAPRLVSDSENAVPGLCLFGSPGALFKTVKFFSPLIDGSNSMRW